MRTATRSPRALAALAFLGLTFCQADPGEPQTDTTIDEGEPHAVYYQLAWDDGGLTADEGDAWSVVTNRDHEVVVLRGWLNTQAAQLVPCALAARAPSFGWGLRQAWAGHSESEDDPTAIATAKLESLLTHPTVELGSALATGTYCAGYVEVGPAVAGVTVDDVDLEGTTLYLELQVDGEARTLWSGATFGRQAQLDDAVDVGADAALVSIERHLAAAFDGIDFDTVSDSTAATLVLNNLLSDTRIHIFAP